MLLPRIVGMSRCYVCTKETLYPSSSITDFFFSFFKKCLVTTTSLGCWQRSDFDADAPSDDVIREEKYCMMKIVAVVPPTLINVVSFFDVAVLWRERFAASTTRKSVRSMISEETKHRYFQYTWNFFITNEELCNEIFIANKKSSF